MYIDIEIILKLASLIGAMGVIGGFLLLFINSIRSRMKQRKN